MRSLLLSLGAAVVATAALAGTAVAGVRAPAGTGRPDYAKAFAAWAKLDGYVTQAGKDAIAVQNALLALAQTPLPGTASLTVNNLQVEVSQFFALGMTKIEATDGVVWRGLRSHASRSRLENAAKSLGAAIAGAVKTGTQLQSGLQTIASALGSTGTTAAQALTSLTTDLQHLSAAQQTLAATLAK